MSDAPGNDLLRYDLMLQRALRRVLRETLTIAAESGLPGAHHLFITFRTGAEDVEIADYLAARYPDEMTIVLQHEYWGLEVNDEGFAVTLSFSNRHERLVIPWSAVTAFADPSVRFGLQFDKAVQGETGESIDSAGEEDLDSSDEDAAASEPAEGLEDKDEPGDNVVTLDRFRKREG